MKVTIETPPPIVPKPVVTIEMSEDEAESLLIICDHIGGGQASRRVHFDHLSKELRLAGIKKPIVTGTREVGAIYFEGREESCQSRT